MGRAAVIIRRTVHGDIIATLREEARLRQGELSTLAGCSQGWLSKVETSVIRRVDTATIERLATILSDKLGRRITVDDLAVALDTCPTCHTPLAQSA